MNFDVSIGGSDVTLEIENPYLLVEIASPGSDLLVMESAAIDLQVQIDNPDLLVEWSTPQLLFPVEGAGIVGGGAVVEIWGETPTGSIDGVNTSFTTAYPHVANRLAVYLNGLRLRRSDDYIEISNQSFQFLSAPLPGDSLSIDYLQS
jgi:hypothetical protein